MTTTKPNMHAVAINPEAWPRQTYFYYFTKIAPSGFSLTVNMDITATLAWTKAHHVTIQRGISIPSESLVDHTSRNAHRLFERSTGDL